MPNTTDALEAVIAAATEHARQARIGVHGLGLAEMSSATRRACRSDSASSSRGAKAENVHRRRGRRWQWPRSWPIAPGQRAAVHSGLF